MSMAHAACVCWISRYLTLYANLLYYQQACKWEGYIRLSPLPVFASSIQPTATNNAATHHKEEVMLIQCSPSVCKLSYHALYRSFLQHGSQNSKVWNIEFFSTGPPASSSSFIDAARQSEFPRRGRGEAGYAHHGRKGTEVSCRLLRTWQDQMHFLSNLLIIFGMSKICIRTHDCIVVRCMPMDALREINWHSNWETQMRTSNCHHLEPSKRDSLVQHGPRMHTLAGTRLNMCSKP